MFFKECKDCLVLKPELEFYTMNRSPDRRQPYCKVCHRERNQNWKERNRFKNNIRDVDYQRARRYGLTKEEYVQKLERQEGVCAICKKAFTSEDGPCIDHCHSTNKVRGLLCRKCNLGIGGLKDNIEILRSAISYLKDYHESYKGPEVPSKV